MGATDGSWYASLAVRPFQPATTIVEESRSWLRVKGCDSWALVEDEREVIRCLLVPLIGHADSCFCHRGGDAAVCSGGINGKGGCAGVCCSFLEQAELKELLRRWVKIYASSVCQ